MTKKLEYNFVKNKFEEKGYILLDTEYINNEHKMNYICKKHPNTTQSIKYANLNSGYGLFKNSLQKQVIEQYPNQEIELNLDFQDIDYLDFNNGIFPNGCSFNDIKNNIFILYIVTWMEKTKKFSYLCEKLPRFQDCILIPFVSMLRKARWNIIPLRPDLDASLCRLSY